MKNQLVRPIRLLVLIGLVALVVGFAGSPTVWAQVEAWPVERTDKKDTEVIPGVADISQAGAAAVEKAINDGDAVVGLPFGPAAARAAALLIIARGDRAVTLSYVTTEVMQNPAGPRPPEPVKRKDLVRIVTIIGANAPATTVDHENSHRIINEVFGGGDFLTAFMLSLIGRTGLGDAEITDLMNQKLVALEVEVNQAWDVIHGRDRREFEKMNQQSIGEALAGLVRAVMIGLLHRLEVDALLAGHGLALSRDAAVALLHQVDDYIMQLLGAMKSPKRLLGFVARGQLELPDLIDDLLRGRFRK